MKKEVTIAPKRDTHKKASRGRGNQGDWASPSYHGTGTLPEHEAHNAAIDAKKAAKRRKK